MTSPPAVADHTWAIEEREYARHEARRGRRHAFEHLDPVHTALVVVDVVPFFVHESAYVRGIVPRVNVLADALRAAGGVVAWVVPGYSHPSAKDREFFGDAVAEMYARSGGDGPPSSRLATGLSRTAEDIVVEKTGRSAYFPGSSDLPVLLAAHEVDTLVVTGTVTNVCVEDTVRDASATGLRVILVADACAAMRDQDHNATLHVVYRSYGDVRSTADVLELMAGG
ncbi:isochorismatase [Nocardioides sp. Root122]|uniref:isochorismatase family cysteine hydrolase n=1 Tax=Nocardioides TaxID=1839 RepID=UPI0007032021|nr:MULTISPECIES: isochorismatase family cysteine hydrolase [Nocardioides]KQV64895.1 isochorismatase [Nocardioides sp. Root122]MCK9823557.1 cysteine hydrolase [Nocardioides cavernae]